jgi:hypothetical protein
MSDDSPSWPAPEPGTDASLRRDADDYAPAVVGAGVAVLGALAAVAASLGSTAGAVVGAAGLVTVGGGLVAGRGAATTAGALLLFVGALAAGAAGGAAAVVLGGGVASLVAYDAGERAVRLGRAVPRGTDTDRVEVVHLIGTLTAGALAGGAGLLVFAVHPRNAPVVWLVATLGVAIALAVGLRPSAAPGDPGA